MDETKRTRLAAIWVGFAVLMAYVTLSDGFTVDAGDLLGLLAVALGLALAVVYYTNPGDILSFGTEE